MITWPANRAAEALDVLARRSGLRPKVGGISTPAAVDPDPTRLGRWIEASAAALGLESEVRYSRSTLPLSSGSVHVHCTDTEGNAVPFCHAKYCRHTSVQYSPNEPSNTALRHT